MKYLPALMLALLTCLACGESPEAQQLLDVEPEDDNRAMDDENRPDGAPYVSAETYIGDYTLTGERDEDSRYLKITGNGANEFTFTLTSRGEDCSGEATGVARRTEDDANEFIFHTGECVIEFEMEDGKLEVEASDCSSYFTGDMDCEFSGTYMR